MGDLMAKPYKVFCYQLVTFSSYGPFSLESFKKNCKMTTWVCRNYCRNSRVVGDQGRGDLEKRKETHPVERVFGTGRSVIFRGKGWFSLHGPFLFIFVSNGFYLNIRNDICLSSF